MNPPPPQYIGSGQGHMHNPSISSAASAPTSYPVFHQQQHMPNGFASSPNNFNYGQFHNAMQMPTAQGPHGPQMMQQPPLPLPGLANMSNSTQLPDQALNIHGGPQGVKPKVTATLWEDENTLCFQVEAGGVCVARREDNRFINGTKLLNVAGMTRGRRDGILKSEKQRHVIKIGPMHLKGVWIPFERAFEFAQKEKITDALFPLFADNIGALLYPSQNGNRPGIGGPAVAASSMPDGMDRRRTDSQAEPIGMTHHSRMPSMPQFQAISGIPQGMQIRAHGDRGNTFPTPPTSASSLMGVTTPVTNSYEWPSSGNMPSSGPMDHVAHRASVPHTPIGTPPVASMNGSGYPLGAPFEASRPMYGHSSHPSYSSACSMGRYNPMHTSPIRNDMGPPARTNMDEKDSRDMYQQGHNTVQQSNETGDGEADADYTHSSNAYVPRGGYAYNMQPVSSHSNNENADPSQPAAGLGSPIKGNGRATPRTSNGFPLYGDSQGRMASMPQNDMYFTKSNVRAEPSSANMYATNYQQQPFDGNNGQTPNGKRNFDTYADDESAQNKRFKPANDERPHAIASMQKR